MWNSYDLFQSRRCHFYICVIISFWINDDNGGDCMRMMIITMARHCQKANGGNWCWQAQMIWWQPMPTFPFAMNPRKNYQSMALSGMAFFEAKKFYGHRAIWCWQAHMIWWQPMPIFPFAITGLMPVCTISFHILYAYLYLTEA